MHTKFTVFAVLLLVLAAVTLVPTLDFPSSEDVSTFIGPRLWPLSLLLLLIVLSAVLLVSTRMSQAKERASDAEAAMAKTAPATDPGQQADAGQDSAAEITPNATSDDAGVALNPGFLAANRHWWLMGTTVAYTLLMPAIGFLLATVIFTLACTLLLGARHWAALLATVVIAVALIQGVFSTLLGIPLP